MKTISNYLSVAGSGALSNIFGNTAFGTTPCENNDTISNDLPMAGSGALGNMLANTAFGTTPCESNK